MKRTFLATLIVLFLFGCSAPRYTGKPIDGVKTKEVLIIHDNDTKSGFEITMKEWLNARGYNYLIADEGSNYESDKLNLEYNGIWKWDLAIYLSRANITAFHQGQKVGEVEYYAPNTLHPGKFSNGAERVSYMMDILFGEKTVPQVNKIITTPKEIEQ